MDSLHAKVQSHCNKKTAGFVILGMAIMWLIFAVVTSLTKKLGNCGTTEEDKKETGMMVALVQWIALAGAIIFTLYLGYLILTCFFKKGPSKVKQS